MIRTSWLAALILAFAPLPCPAQFGGGGGMGGMGGMGFGMGGMMPGGRPTKILPVEEWTVKVEVRDDLSVTGRLKLQGVVVLCDLGLYRIKPEKVKAVEFGAKREEPLIIGVQGAQRRGVVVTASGEKIAGIISIPQDWEVETDLGSLKPEAQNLKGITFLERVSAADPGAGKPNPGPSAVEKPGGQASKPDAPPPSDPSKPR